MRLTMRLMVFSLLAACAVPRPDTTLFVVNSGLHQMKGYNLKNDYDSDGRILAGAKATVRQVDSPQDLNKYTCTDTEGLANLKAYLRTLRSEYANCLQGN